MYKSYAGIGSRETPQDILRLMNRVAIKLEKEGWTLRSGGADGADNAFAQNITNKEIFLPWNNFNGLTSKFIGYTAKAERLAENLHPAWDRCSQGAKKLHSRNVHQILGWDMNKETYSKYVICWTPNGQPIGGTATAIKLAGKAKIKVFNLAIEKDLNKILKYLKD